MAGSLSLIKVISQLGDDHGSNLKYPIIDYHLIMRRGALRAAVDEQQNQQDPRVQVMLI
jgi:hypothetical protein